MKSRLFLLFLSTMTFMAHLNAYAIVGGQVMPSISLDVGFRATVTLFRDGEAFCTGTMITRRIVLTAGHCLDGETASELAVQFFNGQTGQGLESIVHEGYDANAMIKGMLSLTTKDSDDIALLGLAEEIPDGVEVAKLPKKLLPGGIRYKFRTFGVGITGSKKEDGGIMRMVNIDGSVLKTRPTKVIYDQSTGKGVCTGDSGGPHFMYNKGQAIVMAVSTSGDKVLRLFGRAIGDLCRYSGVATQTASYMPWIQESVEELMDWMSYWEDGDPQCELRDDLVEQIEDMVGLDFKKHYDIWDKSATTTSEGHTEWIYRIRGTGQNGHPASYKMFYDVNCNHRAMESL